MNYRTAAELTAFEDRIKAAWEAGELPCLLHLCGGNEEQLVAMFQHVREGDWVLSSHRNHFHALLAGIPEAELEGEIRQGNSMFTFSAARNFLSSSVLAGTCGIAAGLAWAMRESGSDARVWCFLGDGAEEQGHFYEAALFVEANELDCTFIIEDNARQVDTPIEARRSRDTRNPLGHFGCVERYTYESKYPHAGSACAFKITFKPEAVEAMRK